MFFKIREGREQTGTRALYIFVLFDVFRFFFSGLIENRSLVTNTTWTLGVSATLAWCKQADEFLDLMGKFLFPSWDFFQHLNFQYSTTVQI